MELDGPMVHSWLLSSQLQVNVLIPRQLKEEAAPSHLIATMSAEEEPKATSVRTILLEEEKDPVRRSHLWMPALAVRLLKRASF